MREVGFSIWKRRFVCTVVMSCLTFEPLQVNKIVAG